MSCTANTVAKKYITANTYALGLDRTIDVENVAVINISEACELLAKLDIEVLWREFSWFKDMRQENCQITFVC